MYDKAEESTIVFLSGTDVYMSIRMCWFLVNNHLLRRDGGGERIKKLGESISSYVKNKRRKKENCAKIFLPQHGSACLHSCNATCENKKHHLGQTSPKIRYAYKLCTGTKGNKTSVPANDACASS